MSTTLRLIGFLLLAVASFCWMVQRGLTDEENEGTGFNFGIAGLLAAVLAAVFISFSYE